MYGSWDGTMILIYRSTATMEVATRAENFT